MFVQRFLLVFFVILGCLHQAFTHPLTPKIDLLIQKVTKLTYAHDFQTAQKLVLDYLKQDSLSPIEIFYGHFLRADITKSSGNPTKAIDLLLTSKVHLDPIEDKAIFESLIYGNISECYFNKHQYPKAKKYALLSIEFSPQKSIRGSGHAVNHLIIGFSNFIEKDYAVALNAYQKAIQQYQLAGDFCELPLCYNKIAAVYLEQNEYTLAEQALKKSLAISDSCDIDQYRLLSNIALFDYYKHKKDYKNALDLSHKIHDLRTSIYNEQQKHALDHLEMKYEMELTQKENENLKRNAKIKADDNSFLRRILIGSILSLLILLTLGSFLLRVRNKKNALLSNHLQKIETQNKEREVLLKEIHHRVKNNLQVITSLLHLQSHQNNDQNVQNLFKQSQYRINTMAMVHEILYQSGNLSKIQLKIYLEELANSLIRSIRVNQETVSTHFDISENVHLGLDTAIPLGLLSNEIITNALIHGIPKDEKGEFYIRIEAQESPNYTLYIGDNGIGCPKDLSLNNVNTLGLSLVKKLTRQLSGTIQKDDSKKGCHYKITFKEVE